MTGKKLIPKVLSIFSLFIVLLVIQPNDLQAQEAGQTHIVQQGESLFSISREYNVSVGDIRRWNQLQTDQLQTGQELKVGPPLQAGATTHTVERGETLFAISRIYGVTIAEIQAWNGLDDISLSTGQELVIYAENGETTEVLPPPEAEPDDLQPVDRESIVRTRESGASNTYYTVRSGDTLNRIAREHNMSLDELRELNNLQGDLISIGQVLTVRDFQSAPSVAESAEESTPQGKFVTYRVESGENVGDLIGKFQLTENQLVALNPGFNFENLSSGQRITVLLPTTRIFENPYKKGASLENLGDVPVSLYPEDAIADPTTSGELYNPDELTAAHSNMSLGNVVYIENPANGTGIYVRINDRYSGNGLKLSQKAFEMLQFSSINNARVSIYLDQ